jgi:beta-galactosidase GanA
LSFAFAAASDIPHLQKQGTATQLIVDGKPFLALAGELSNNAATDPAYIRPAWPKLAAANLNTVLAGVSWAQIEPEEGKFDFHALDGVIQDARSNNLRLVLLWFASWKNGLSSYAPDWVKKDFERFPRAQAVGDKTPLIVLGESRKEIVGSLNLELLTPLSDANRDADARAFAALMRHVKEVDGQQHTVIMIQVENEIGMAADTRDRSPLANKAYAGPVPKELMDYLQEHKDSLIPEFKQVWGGAGFKTSGTWEDVFGRSPATDEIFMAWNFARYIGRVVQEGKAEYPLPMFLNSALPRTTTIADVVGSGYRPGSRIFAIGGPMDDLMDVWRAGAPQLDMLSPDAYSDRDFTMWCARYARSGNPLWIPESDAGPEGAAKILYAIGRYDAIGLSAMGIERDRLPLEDTVSRYGLIAQMAPLILQHQGNGTMSAVFLGPNDPPQKVKLGNYTLEVTHLKPRPVVGLAAPVSDTQSSAAIFIATGPDEYFVGGSGVAITFSPNTPGPPLAGLATVEEGKFLNGAWVPGLRLAGDDAGEGQNIALYRNKDRDTCALWFNREKEPPPLIECPQRVTLYRYR